MDIRDDFGRVWRFAFGVKGASPEFRSALQRLLDWVKPKVRVPAVLNLTNEERQRERRARVFKIRAAVEAARDDARPVRRERGFSEHGAITAAIARVARQLDMTEAKVKKLYYAKDVLDPHHTER